MKQGIIFIETKNGESGDNPYRTGRFAVVKEDAVKRLLKSPEDILRKRVCFVPEEVSNVLGIFAANI